MSCHHSGPSTQWTGLLLRVSPTEDKCTITIDTPTPLCPSLPGKKKDKAFRICSSETWSSCVGVSPPVFPKLLSVQVLQAKEPQRCPMSLLATCALLLHTLSPLYDHSTVRKGLLVCTTQVHRISKCPKLPAGISRLLVLTWPSWCRGCSETG